MAGHIKSAGGISPATQIVSYLDKARTIAESTPSDFWTGIVVDIGDIIAKIEAQLARSSRSRRLGVLTKPDTAVTSRVNHLKKVYKGGI